METKNYVSAILQNKYFSFENVKLSLFMVPKVKVVTRIHIPCFKLMRLIWQNVRPTLKLPLGDLVIWAGYILLENYDMKKI